MATTYLGLVIKNAPAASSVGDDDLIGIVDPVTGAVKSATKDQLATGGGSGGVYVGDNDDLESSSNRAAFPTDTQGVLVEIDALPGGASVDNIFYYDSPTGGKYLSRIIYGPVRAANCGVKAANSAATNSTNLQAAFNHAGVNEVMFDEPGGAAISLTGTITIPAGKVIAFGTGNRITGACTISGGIIRAERTQHIFDTTVTVVPEGSTSGEFSVKWYGALGNNSTDDTAAIQAAINSCIVAEKISIVRFPYGQYVISQGLVARSTTGAGQPSVFFSLSLLGEVFSYATGPIGATSAIRCTHVDNFAIGIQRGKGVVVDNLAISGMNTLNFTYEQVISSATNWVINGCRDNGKSPYSAIVIDPFGQPSITESDRYPDFSDLYSEVGGGGSTNIYVRNCAIRGFVVGVCISPSTTQQNAELISVEDCIIEEGIRSAVTTGNSQTRTVWVRNIRCWGSVECVVDSVRYGGGGSHPELIGANIAGGVKYLTLNSTVSIPYAKFTDVYAESLYSIGGDFFTVNASSQMWFTNCEIKLMGGEFTSSPMTMLVRANMVSFNKCIVAYYATGLSLAFPVDCRMLSAIDCKLFGVFQDVNYNPVLYKNCKVIGFFETPISNNEYVLPPNIEDGRMIVAQGGMVRNSYHDREYRNGPLVTVVEAVDTAITLVDSTTVSFNIGAGNINIINVGDFVYLGGNGGVTYTDPNSLAVGRFFVLGKISNINTGTNVVTVNNVSVSFVLTNGANYRFRVVAMCPVYRTHLGDIASGSANITNVVGEGNAATMGMSTGDFVSHPAFGLARVTGVSGTTVTVHKNASYSETEAAICSTEYRANVVSNATDFLATAFKVACKKGDIILNDYKTSSDDLVDHWVCTKSGILNSSDMPVFKAVNATP
jgi:hypothetical protein